MDPVLQFEAWVIDTLKQHNIRAHKTPVSHDGGADVIALYNDEQIIIQVKHTQTGGRCPDEAIKDLVRAKEAYKNANAKLVIVTNGNGMSKPSLALARSLNIELVDRNRLLSWPSQILNKG